MPLLKTPGTGTPYYLVRFDGAGAELPEDDGALLSERILAAYAEEPPSDVFIFSHGWRNDLPAAVASYGAWVDLMATQQAQVAAARATKGWRPLLIGVHWPSEPWGRERLPPAENPGAMERLVGRYAALTTATADGMAALRTIFERARAEPLPAQLPGDVATAVTLLERETLPAGAGVGAPPGADRERFKADEAYMYIQDQVRGKPPAKISFASAGRSLLDFVRVFSFWKMKDRARLVGEGDAHRLLRRLQGAFGRATRVHVMGHSFGCIVVSAMVCGAPGAAGPVRPVHSMALVQGALSCWAYCPSLPARPERPGYFRPLAASGMVAGPLVSVYSVHDTAVRIFYRIGAGMLMQMDYAGKPDWFAALGRFGAQDIGARQLELNPYGRPLGLAPGGAYNLNADRVIRRKSGVEGAHNDIGHPEVAGAVWEAALAR